MRLWTVQTETVYDIIMKNGIFVCDPTHKDVDQDFKPSYEWLVKEMEKRIGKRPNGVVFPIWAWHTRYGIHNPPDIREAGYGTPGRKYLLMEIEIPDDKVVLTDYDAWHYVLNNWYIGASTNEKEYAEETKWLYSLDRKTIDEEKKKSWQRIFDTIPFKNEWMSKGQFIQATFWELRAENIIAVREFIAK